MSRERLGILALLAAFIGGALLVTAAGGPPWLALGYAALGACVAAYRLRRGGRRRPVGYEPGPRIDAAGQLAFGPAPRPAPAEPVRPPAPAPAPAPSPSLEASAPVTRRFEPASQIVASDAALGYALIDRTTPEGSDEVATAIRSECAERRLRLRKIARDVEAAPGDPQARPALRWALDQLNADEAQTLVVAKLGHLADTAAGLPELLHWLSVRNRRLIAIDVQLDTATEAGERTAEALAQVGAWEREKLSQRTRRGLEAARSRGPTGRPAVADLPELRERIVAMRDEGMTLQAIADALNEEGVPTIRGGAKWRPSSVQAATGYRRPSVAKRLPQDGPPGAG